MDNEKGKSDLAIVIASKMKKKDEGDKGQDSYKELAEMLIKAVKDENAEKLAKDLKTFVKMCMGE